MESCFLFKDLTNTTLRQKVTRSLLKISCLIPSLKSFYKNVKYLDVGAKILKDLVLGKGTRDTLYNTLYK